MEDRPGEITRLTQAQRRARTRDKLFKATLEVAADHGLEAVSTRKVAAAAGLTMGAIYAHFESRDDLLRCALEYYRANVPTLDVADARSVRDLLCRRVCVRLGMADVPDEPMVTIHRLQNQLSELRRTDPAVGTLIEQWHASRLDVLAARIAEVADQTGERLVADLRLFAAQAFEISEALARLRMDRPGLVPDAVGIAAMNALVDAAVA
jgi:AcrR family transcriptional regulator